ncbi:hypothetical protein C4F51_01845 [Cellvibrio sp. KB43]|uniref:Uncharacterized protein n=1 Tax=Cellvibrio polysaccharolyticus TaxID=2082724 RepID=A0A928UZ73_9GAMM|nr:hypothetical protein [Cellvibrio polysaccharolyticus]
MFLAIFYAGLRANEQKTDNLPMLCASATLQGSHSPAAPPFSTAAAGTCQSAMGLLSFADYPFFLY